MAAVPLTTTQVRVSGSDTAALGLAYVTFRLARVRAWFWTFVLALLTAVALAATAFCG